MNKPIPRWGALVVMFFPLILAYLFYLFQAPKGWEVVPAVSAVPAFFIGAALLFGSKANPDGKSHVGHLIGKIALALLILVFLGSIVVGSIP